MGLGYLVVPSFRFEKEIIQKKDPSSLFIRREKLLILGTGGFNHEQHTSSHSKKKRKTFSEGYIEKKRPHTTDSLIDISI